MDLRYGTEMRLGFTQLAALAGYLLQYFKLTLKNLAINGSTLTNGAAVSVSLLPTHPWKI